MWVKIKSWHRFSPGSARTLCGRLPGTGRPTADTFGDEASCESCLRIAERRGL